MLAVFEVHIAPGSDPDTLLTEETKRETKAQIMTLDEAKAVGFSGIPDMNAALVRLIAVNRRDAPWIHRSLESNAAVSTFRMHEVDA
jgi:hypothetical protein